MAAIKLLTGTTADYQETESVLILDEREIAVEIVTSDSGDKYFNIRQGDGKSTFFNLPIIVNNQRYEELTNVLDGYVTEMKEFTTNMNSATSLANQAAEAANTAATAANNAATQVTNLTAGLNSITDDETGEVYTLGIESGVLYLKDSSDE